MEHGGEGSGRQKASACTAWNTESNTGRVCTPLPTTDSSHLMSILPERKKQRQQQWSEQFGSIMTMMVVSVFGSMSLFWDYGAGDAVVGKRVPLRYNGVLPNFDRMELRAVTDD